MAFKSIQYKKEKPLSIPQHVAIIMDGNGRWAKKRFLPVLAGHSEGRKTLRKTVENAISAGIKYLTVYALSTENLKQRSPDEIGGLFKLLKSAIYEEFDDLYKNGVRVSFIGNIAVLPQEVRDDIAYIQNKTKECDKLYLQIALNYGGRDEIVRAINSMIENEINITEENITKNILNGVPEPDMLIRTGGDFRVSNFLLWQIAYTEIVITPTLWPDFDNKTLMEAIKEYNKRVRNFGGRNA